MLETAIKGLATQQRVVVAVILRELRTRFGAYHLGYLWAVIVPLLYILVLTTLYSAIGRKSAHGVPIEALLLPGMMAWLTFLDVQAHASTAYQGNRQLLVYPMVTVMDIVVARTLLEFATKAVATATIMTLYLLWGVEAAIDDPLGVILGVAAVAYLGMTFGHVVGCLSVIAPSTRFVVTTLRRVLFFTSGALFLLSDIPEHWRAYILINPLAHVIDMVRGAWIESYAAPYGDPSYVAAAAVMLTAAAALAETQCRRKREGVDQ